MAKTKELWEQEVDKIFEKYESGTIGREPAKEKLVNLGFTIDDAENALGVIDELKSNKAGV